MKSHDLAHFIVWQVVIQTQIAFNKPSKSSLSQEKEKKSKIQTNWNLSLRFSGDKPLRNNYLPSFFGKLDTPELGFIQ